MSLEFSKVPFILLCCVGRSGSTLLLRLLNSIPGYHIMGENKVAIQNLLNFYLSIKHVIEVNETVDDEHFKLAWNNEFDFEDVQDDIYSIFWNLFWNPKKRVFGFKEIRFGIEDYQDFENELNAFKELFPNLKIIFLTRDIKELIKSSWWAEDPEDSKIHIKIQNKNFSKYIKKIKKELPENETNFIYHITYADIVKKSNNFIKLYDFLGESFSEKEYIKVMEKVTR